MNLYFGENPPCGDVSYSWTKRNVTLSKVYNTGYCSFKMNYTLANGTNITINHHPEYIETGLQESEYEIL